jgi:outer membrane receptor protein involved in Fe transport
LNNDDAGSARKEVSIILGLEPTFDAGSSPRFAALVAQVRREELSTQVASVSKTSESLREAPATVLVVTADEIQRRGYLDLEQLLHDLPGFDVTRANGSSYAWIEQRGYVSTDNDRLILLIDGVEQGDLTTNTVSVSRQYPLSNIDHVEIVYGPASTMYGANAYTGVISIITKQAETLVDEKKSFGFRGQATNGERWRMFDVTAAGRDHAGTFAWSLAASVQSSKEPDLSKLSQWDYTYSGIDYKTLMELKVTPAERTALCAPHSPYIDCSGTDNVLKPTDAGVALVRGLDAALIAENGLGVDDRAKNWGLNGALRISNLTLGVQAWRSQEGAATDITAETGGGNASWTPRFTSLYLKYSVPIDRLKVNVFSRYLQTTVERSDSLYTTLHNYSSGILSLRSLVASCVTPNGGTPVDCVPARPWVETVRYGLLSTQLRNEINVTYDSPGKWNAVAGAELAKSAIQATWSRDTTGPGQPYLDPSYLSEQIEHTDAAFYAQGSYRPRPPLKFILAGRLSHNEIPNKPGASGYGTLFTPRAGVIYSALSNALTLKAIYSEAFKDPTDLQKFGTGQGAHILEPESVKNIELSAGWQPSQNLSAEATVYQARYSDVVKGVSDNACGEECGLSRFVNGGSVDIQGVQLTGRYRHGRGDFWGNYTHARPFAIDPLDDSGKPLLDEEGNRVHKARLPYIAAHRANFGVDVDWSSRLRSSLRAHYAGARSLGGETADAYASADAVIGYRIARANATLQLIVQNLFDRIYFVPTPVGLLPLEGRTVYLRLIYGGSGSP